ncbi:MAG: patatin-like phospholipase family protein [Anaerolineales bacterium]|nr:patatin-like phospholipase family protein [Anaerolineales bacterium]MCA9977338.1 patatin-like phospholipase family protein [Anaerolineales bacterium]
MPITVYRPPRQMAAVNGRSHVGLALGGGVVRGFAHVGVLSVLDEAGIPIDYIAGASVGAIIGAAYATGMKLPHIAQMAEGLQWLRLAKPVLSRDGLVSFAKLEAWLAQTFGHLHFEDLTHPFVIVATDLETAEPVVLDSGPLAPAIRASCSVPGVVTPLRLNGRLLCDGGISNNLPVAPLRQLGADYVIGVDIFQHAAQWPYLGPLGRGLAAIEIMVEHSGGGLEKADCLIAPDLSGKTYIRFGKREELIALGRAATKKQIPLIRQQLQQL